MAESFSFADSLSCKGSFTSLGTPDLIFPLPLIRELYLKDQNCSGCKRKFNVPGLSNSLKNICQFCYRGVCGRCMQFEYFHSETGCIEPMCSNCNYTLVSLGSKQEILIDKCRMERAEVKKAIRLANKQKEQFGLERKIVQEKVKKLKIIQDKAESELMVELEKLIMEEKELKIRAEFANQKKSEFSFKQRLLSQKFSSNLITIQAIKNDKESESKEIEGIREKLNSFYYKIAKSGNLFGENERVCELELEIEELQGKILDKSEILGNVEVILSDLKAHLEENTEKIEILTAKCKDSNKIKEDEQRILDSMVSQIDELDDLVLINQEILKSSKALEEESDFNTGSMIDTQETEVESMKEKLNKTESLRNNLENLNKNKGKNTQKVINDQKGCRCSVM